MNTKMERFLDQASNLHTAPPVALRVLELTSADDFDIDSLVRCLEHDPALALRLLKLVNSARFGLSRQIGGLRQAVVLLGRRSLRMFVTTFTLLDTLTRGDMGQLYQDYWRKSLTLASVSRRLAMCLSREMADDAYTAGLLADIGSLCMAQGLGEGYLDIYRECSDGDELVLAEEKTFGFDHAELGAKILERWSFAEELIDAVATHHQTIDEHSPISLVVQSADLCADAMWTPHSPRLAIAREVLFHAFGIDTDGFIDLAIESKNDFKNNCESFGVRIDQQLDCEAITQQARRQLFDTSIEAALDLDSLTAAFEERSA